jgi:hypothetical protein
MTTNTNKKKIAIYQADVLARAEILTRRMFFHDVQGVDEELKRAHEDGVLHPLKRTIHDLDRRMVRFEILNEDGFSAIISNA